MATLTAPIATSIRALRNPEKALEILSGALHLWRSAAPPSVVLRYLGEPFTRAQTERFREAQSDFRALASSLRFSNDWFTGHIPYWMHVFHRCRLDARPAVEGLEIGSWQGLSSLFLLSCLPNLELTCVDTWEGCDIMQANPAVRHVEEDFDANLSRFGSRLVKYKGTSVSYFEHAAKERKFDLVYVDGSHRCDDVLVDALKSFEHLRTGGIMIFDDYLWRQYRRRNDNPAAAINAFLKMKRGLYAIVRVYWQLIILKTSDAP